MKKNYLTNYDWSNDILDADDVFDDETADELRYQAAEIEAEDDPDIDVETEVGNIIHLWAVPTDSMLYAMLLFWYGSEDKLQKHVRTCFYTNKYLSENAGEKTRLMCFTTGCGYDIMDADLLGGNANGLTKRAFNRFVDSLMLGSDAKPYTGKEANEYND